ncbi:MAG: hypothetical protein WA061_03995 [Microgenomates group bacterium]
MHSHLFNPINDTSQLLKTIEYIHVECHRLCKKNLGYLLPVAGNIGVFCHFEDEFIRLTRIREELTEANNNWNKKYFKLHVPIIIPQKNEIPATTYTYLYIRKPNKNTPHIGDVDFYMEPNKFLALKQSLLEDKTMEGVSIFNRPDLDLIRLFDPEINVSSFIGQKTMIENIL